MAPTYVHGHNESVLESHRRRTVADSAAYLRDDLRPGISVLDVGCGPGSITADIAALVSPGVVTAIDSSPDAVGATRTLCADRGLRNVEVAVADVHALAYADDTFDAVHAHQVLQHLPEPDRALREMRRVCRPGGIVAARDADYAAMTWYPPVPELDEWLTIYRDTARADGGQPDAGRRLLHWALRAGFTDVTPSASTWCYATPDTRLWWGTSWAERVTASTFAERAVAHGFATRPDLERIAGAWRAWAHDPAGWFTVLHAEVRCIA